MLKCMYAIEKRRPTPYWTKARLYTASETWLIILSLGGALVIARRTTLTPTGILFECDQYVDVIEFLATGSH